MNVRKNLAPLSDVSSIGQQAFVWTKSNDPIARSAMRCLGTVILCAFPVYTRLARWGITTRQLWKNTRSSIPSHIQHTVVIDIPKPLSCRSLSSANLATPPVWFGTGHSITYSTPWNVFEPIPVKMCSKQKKRENGISKRLIWLQKLMKLTKGLHIYKVILTNCSCTWTNLMVDDSGLQKGQIL